jgi:hypothetical protein
MAPDERPDEEQDEQLRITDRRRFTETGEARDEGEAGAEARPEPAASPAEPGVATPPDEPTAAPASMPEGLGIGSVFLAFWQGALMNLGAADPTGNRLPVNLEAARESIELLRVLQQKTVGNLSEEEDGMLRHLLHEAQMAYVQVAGGTGEGGGES